AGWRKSVNVATLPVGPRDARVRYYPSATGGFFLTGGLGLGSLGATASGFGSASETGVGLMLGFGVDLRIGNSLSVTPFWDGFAINTSNSDANVGQIGIGLTTHTHQ